MQFADHDAADVDADDRPLRGTAGHPPPDTGDEAAVLAAALARPFDTSRLPAYAPSVAHEARIAAANYLSAAAAFTAAADAAEAAAAAGGSDAQPSAPLLHREPLVYPVPHQPYPVVGPGRVSPVVGTSSLAAAEPATGTRSLDPRLVASRLYTHGRRSRRDRSAPTTTRSDADTATTDDDSHSRSPPRNVHWLDRALGRSGADGGGAAATTSRRELGAVPEHVPGGDHAVGGAYDAAAITRVPLSFRRRFDSSFEEPMAAIVAAAAAAAPPDRPRQAAPDHRRRRRRRRHHRHRVDGSDVSATDSDVRPGRRQTRHGQRDDRRPADARLSMDTEPAAPPHGRPSPRYYGHCPAGGSPAPVVIPTFGPDRRPSPHFVQPPNAPPEVHLALDAPPPSTAAVPAGNAASSRWHPTRHKALLIGAGYSGDPRAELAGPTTDVRIVRYVLTNKFGFDESAIRVLTDDPNTAGLSRVRLLGTPTRAAILAAATDLVAGARRGDTLFFFFAGHGTRVVDTSGDEIDGFDEAIVPIDYATEGVIIDDELYDTLVRNLPAGVRLFALFDACHSATALDLPYVFSPVPLTGTAAAVGEGIRSLRTLPAAGADGGSSSPSSDGEATSAGRLSSSSTDNDSDDGRARDHRRGRDRDDASRRRERRRRRRRRPHTSPTQGALSSFTGAPLPPAKAAVRASHRAPDPWSAGFVLSLSACADASTASDAKTAGGIAAGAMTYAFVDTVEQAGSGRAWARLTWAELLVRMRNTLQAAGHRQQAQICSNVPCFNLLSRLGCQW